MRSIQWLRLDGIFGGHLIQLLLLQEGLLEERINYTVRKTLYEGGDRSIKEMQQFVQKGPAILNSTHLLSYGGGAQNKVPSRHWNNFPVMSEALTQTEL